jgi:hypothetical protein
MSWIIIQTSANMRLSGVVIIVEMLYSWREVQGLWGRFGNMQYIHLYTI